MKLPTNVQQQMPLSELSTFRIGGPAHFCCEVMEGEQLKEILCYCTHQNIRYIVIGNGSNCLFDSRGFEGMVIKNAVSSCIYEDTKVTVGAGYSFSRLGSESSQRGLSGLEFACGIPGTVGGAVSMNAGAMGGCVGDVVKSVTVITEESAEVVLANDEMKFGYRSSSLSLMKGAVFSATFMLQQEKDAFARSRKIVEKRKQLQPYGQYSAGSIFRNPSNGISAGMLIDRCGLKGKRCGGATVSEKHANFIVNDGTATSHDVLQLIWSIKDEVKNQTGIALQEEILYIPY